MRKRKETKVIQIGKEKNEAVFVLRYHDCLWRKFKKSNKKSHRSNYSKFSGYKINMWNQMLLFISTMNKINLKLKHVAIKLKDTLWKPRQCIRKQRYHFADKGPYSQSYGFPVVMNGCESWTIKKAEP